MTIHIKLPIKNQRCRERWMMCICSAEEVFSDTDSDTDSDSDDDVEEVWCDDMAVCKNAETLSQNPYLPGSQKEERDTGADEEDRASITDSVEIDCHGCKFLQPVFDTYDSDSSDEDEGHSKHQMIQELPLLTSTKSGPASSGPLEDRNDIDRSSSPQIDFGFSTHPSPSQERPARDLIAPPAPSDSLICRIFLTKRPSTTTIHPSYRTSSPAK